MELNGSRRVASLCARTSWRKTRVPVLALEALLILMFSAGATSSGESCPKHCSCSQRQVWCNSQGFNAVPANLPRNTKKLYLFDNNITVIPPGSLSRLKHLEVLVMSNNKLTSGALRSQEISSLNNLQELVLTDNKLTTIPGDLFSGMGTILRLYLGRNHIHTIDQNAFRNMSNLVELKLTNNKLTTFPKIIGCPKLQRICLENNRLRRLRYDSFTQLNLEELMLSGNQLSSLPSSVFRSTSSLRELDISDNQFRKVPKIIRNMTSLRALNLSSNSIATLPDDLLQGMARLKILDIHDMELTRLPETFIPKGVFLNFADFSNNLWICDCDIVWLPKLMRFLEGAFVKLSMVKCNEPQNLRDRQLVTINDEDLNNCASTFDSGTGNTRGDANQPPKQHQPPPRKPTVDLCDGLACANGAICRINQSNYMPACRCTAGWTGVLCDKPAIVQRPPTTTTAKVSPVPNPGSSSQPQLVIQKNKLTPTSVMIILPRIDRQLTVTLFKIKDMAPGNQVLLDTYTIVPTQHPYTVDNLLAGTRYNICITATDFVPNGREIKDKLCGVVRTPPAASVTVRPDPKTENPETGPSPSPDDGAAVDDSSSDGGGHTGGKSSERDSVPDDDFKLLYPAIGAGIGALVILIAIIIFCVCYRKKKKLKRATSTDSGRPVTPKDYADRTTSTPATDIEAVPIMAQQGRVQYIPQPAITTALMQQPSDLYQPQTPQHGFQSVCASPQRVGTPNRTGSLGRSSTSGGSVAGSQAPYALDQQRPCPSDSGYETIRSIPGPAIVDDVGSHTGYHVNGGMYAGHAPYTASQVPCTTAYVPVLTNRNQEYLYMSNGHAGQHAVYADPRFVEHSVQPVVVPVRSTSTTVNQYHQGVISATTVSPESLYTPSAVSNGYTSVPAMPTHYSSHNQMAPRYSASRTPRDAYGPIITSAAFKDTLVM